MGKKKPSIPVIIGETILLVGLAVGAKVGLEYSLYNHQIKTEKNRLYPQVFTIADKNTNNQIDYEEAYNLGRALKVIPETNFCPLTTFDEVYKKASLENISNYIK